jgi:hypothetical protein
MCSFENPCVWIDILGKESCVIEYLDNCGIEDPTCKRNVEASLNRLLPFYDIAVLHFRYLDIAVVRLAEFASNPALHKCLEEAKDNMRSVVQNVSDPYIFQRLERKLEFVVDFLNSKLRNQYV